MKTRHLIPALALTAACIPNAHAVEGALGRPVSSMTINPFAGVVPPDPGFVSQLVAGAVGALFLSLALRVFGARVTGFLKRLLPRHSPSLNP